jgi:hypothetical protein
MGGHIWWQNCHTLPENSAISARMPITSLPVREVVSMLGSSITSNVTDHIATSFDKRGASPRQIGSATHYVIFGHRLSKNFELSRSGGNVPKMGVLLF